MSEKSERQEPYRLTINHRTFDVRDLSPDCAFEIFAGDDGGLLLVCTASARIYGLGAAEAESLANDMLRMVGQIRSSRSMA